MASKVLDLYHGRVDEQYILTQLRYHYESESFTDHKNRMADGDRLYRGDLIGLFADETKLPNVPLVENKFKNALHDLARLASEGRGAVKSIPRGDRDRDMRRAQVAESIAEGYWVMNRMRTSERQLYMDIAGSGMVLVCAYYDDRSPYPQLARLNPRFCYPDVRGGKLQSLLFAENVRERVLARQFPHLGLDESPTNTNEAMFVSYYDDEVVREAVVRKTNDAPSDVMFTDKTWVHELGCVPVGFEMLDTYDGAFHGLFEQLGGPIMFRNKILRFMGDYIEQIAHSPIVAEAVLNLDQNTVLGPDTVLQLDPNAERSSIGRLAPASPAGTIFGLLQYMEEQEARESTQPPARVGVVPQSIASGSFVDRTQGQLTSLVKELQDKMASLREQLNECCFRIDEKFMDEPKPLWRPVAGRREYTPSEDIDGWYYHEVKFGAGAGLDRMNADTRVERHLLSGLISKEEARAEIDYLDDSASSQDKIDRERLQEVLFARLAQDPATPMSALGAIWLDMKTTGDSLDEALQKHLPEILDAEKAQTQQQPAIAGVPSAPSAPGDQTGELERVPIARPPISILQNRSF